MWLTILNNSYTRYLLIFLLAISLGYYKGYSSKSDEVEIQRLQEFKLVTEKLDKVYKYSVDKSDESKKYILNTNTKLQSILSQIGQTPLTSTPCVPTEEFASKWNQLNDALKD